MDFYSKISSASIANDSLLCIGLDTDSAKLPAGTSDLVEFNKRIIDATKELVCAFKPNSAFYEAYGPSGFQALLETVEYIRDRAPSIPVILDYKRADIGNTNLGYLTFAYEYLGVDAVTVNPYMGQDSLRPFLEVQEKGVIVLCRTSNPGAGEFQDLQVGTKKLYQCVAERVSKNWNTQKNCALVVGATNPAELKDVREIVGDGMLLLIPGIGAQGGDIRQTVEAGCDSEGKGVIINSSRSIIYASSGEDFADAARHEAQKLKEKINQYRRVGNG